MEGPLPSSLCTLHKLRHLNVSMNSMRHRIPLELGNLEDLEILDLHGNNLEGPLPDSLAHLRKLRYFHIFESIPSETTSPPIQFDDERHHHLCRLHAAVGIDSFSCDVTDLYEKPPSMEERDAEKALVRRALRRSNFET